MLGADAVAVGGRPILFARTPMRGVLADARSRGCHYRLDPERERRIV